MAYFRCGGQQNVTSDFSGKAMFRGQSNVTFSDITSGTPYSMGAFHAGNYVDFYVTGLSGTITPSNTAAVIRGIKLDGTVDTITSSTTGTHFEGYDIVTVGSNRSSSATEYTVTITLD